MKQERSLENPASLKMKDQRSTALTLELEFRTTCPISIINHF